MSVFKGVFQPIEDAMNGFAGEERPENLYHYTNLTALEGIFESTYLRAMHRFTDSIDIEHGPKLALRVIENWEGDSSTLSEQLKSKILNKLTINFNNLGDSAFTYSASFTGLGNSEHHWQKYASQGKGCAIEFNLSRLRRHRDADKTSDPLVTEDPAFYFYKTSYDEGSQEADLLKLLRSALECMPGVIRHFQYEPLEHLARFVVYSIELLAIRRHMEPGLCDDREWKAIPVIVRSDDERIMRTPSGQRYLPLYFSPDSIQRILVGQATRRSPQACVVGKNSWHTLSCPIAEQQSTAIPC